MRYGIVGRGLAFVLFGSTSAAFAEPRVSVSLSDCDTSLSAEVRRIAGVELRATVTEPNEPHIITRAIVVCHDMLADLWVADSATAKVLTRTVTLADQPTRVRARLLALAISELVFASWEELERPEPKVPAAEPPPPAVRTMVKRNLEGTPSALADVVADARLFSEGTTFAFGGGARLRVALPWTLAFRGDLLFDYGRARRTGHDVTMTLFGGSLGIGRPFGFGVVDFFPYVAARGGYGSIAGVANGDTTPASTRDGPWLGPELGLDFTIAPQGWLHFTATFAGGYAAAEVRGFAQNDRDVAIGGAWLALTLGVGLSRR